MSKRKTIFYAAVPTVFTGIMAVVFLLGILPAAKAAVYEWRGIWIMGAPEYTYSADNSLMNDEAGEKKQPGRLTVGTQYGELFCERIDWRVPLYYGDSEELLTLGAGTYTGFGIPGEGKRILVGAHDTTFFSALGQLETGDFIELDTIYGSFKYRVTHTDIADVSEASLEDTDREELILYTCYPIGETKEVRTERYLVYADACRETADGE